MILLSICNISDMLAVVRHLVLRRGVKLPRHGRLCRVVTGRLGVPRIVISLTCVAVRALVVMKCVCYRQCNCVFLVKYVLLLDTVCMLFVGGCFSERVS